MQNLTLNFHILVTFSNLIRKKFLFRSYLKVLSSGLENAEVHNSEYGANFISGAVLHLHDLAMADYRWLISNITTMKICYMCYNTGTQKIQFKVAYNTPNSTANCHWISVPSVRSQAKNQSEFDNQLYSNLTMTDGDPKQLYPTQKALWDKFGGIFAILSGLLG